MADNKDRKIYEVSEITGLIRGHLEDRFGDVTVTGEIGNWKAAPSGHAYFSLKDENALLQSVMWRSAFSRVRFRPAEGMKVVCRGRISVFEPRGQYQLIVDSMQEAGEGDLWRQFEELKQKFENEGLFDPARKRPLPEYPRTVGVVTSPTGAVIRDIVNVLGRRAPSVRILLHPARVQGTGSAEEIARAVERLGRSGHIDVLIVGRGGGSLEDLWEFNSERLARAIAACPVPVVSAVGHETDFTICDFVADLRAPTPSAAAEIVSMRYADLLDRLYELTERSRRALQNVHRDRRRHLEGLLASHALRQPELLLRDSQQRVDLALERMSGHLSLRLERAQAGVRRLLGSIEGHNPELILKKGYAIVRRARDGKVLVSVKALKKNLPVDMELHDGTRRAVVTDDNSRDLFE